MGSRRQSDARPSVTYQEDIEKGKDEPAAASTPKSKSKVQSKSSIQEDPSSQYLTQLPVIPSQPEKYNPTPYTFRMPVEKQTDEIKESYAKCPPFYLQLDHTLAVVWCIFSKQTVNKPLGIAQLQWALSFLKGIYNREGERSKDVAICIQAIEDELIEQYAAMVDDAAEEPLEGAKGGCAACCSGKKKDKKGESEKNDGAEAKASASEAEADKKKNGEESDDVRNSKSEGETSNKARSTKSEVVTKTFPFSFNYSDMMKSSPVCVEQIYKAKPEKFMTDAEMRREYEQIRENGGKPADGSCSRDDMLNFLKEWRKEQVAKIESELKRLHSIENFMELCNKDNKDS